MQPDCGVSKVCKVINGFCHISRTMIVTMHDHHLVPKLITGIQSTLTNSKIHCFKKCRFFEFKYI